MLLPMLLITGTAGFNYRLYHDPHRGSIKLPVSGKKKSRKSVVYRLFRGLSLDRFPLILLVGVPLETDAPASMQTQLTGEAMTGDFPAEAQDGDTITFVRWNAWFTDQGSGGAVGATFQTYDGEEYISGDFIVGEWGVPLDAG